MTERHRWRISQSLVVVLQLTLSFHVVRKLLAPSADSVTSITLALVVLGRGDPVLALTVLVYMV